MVLVPLPCNKFVGTEAEGVNVILPEADVEYPEVIVVPPIVILVIAALQPASSVKVTSKGASTVAPAAAVNVGAILLIVRVFPEAEPLTVTLDVVLALDNEAEKVRKAVALEFTSAINKYRLTAVIPV
jgi:hypothetical protein